MKKLYTNNHANITTCDDFEIKFKDYLNYIKFSNPILFNSFTNNLDFKIQDFKIFKAEFNSFFEFWLKETFNYHLSFNIKNIDSFITTYRTIDEKFSELFANYNFYKKLNSAIDEFYIYDITTDEEIKYKKIINDKPLI
ncbi:hypothetical protein [Chryseobacterium aquaticum]|uniref:hypothetical protein n=1 Tax=Chryseobacterium aquaticum TaxID=452084 RepID=UPI003F6FA86F